MNLKNLTRINKNISSVSVSDQRSFWFTYSHKRCSTSIIRNIYILRTRDTVALKKIDQNKSMFQKRVGSQSCSLTHHFFLEKITFFYDATTLEMFLNRKLYVCRPPKNGLEEKASSETRKFGRKQAHDLGLHYLWWQKKGLAKNYQQDQLQILTSNFAKNRLPNMKFCEIFQKDNAPIHNVAGKKLGKA